MSVFKASGRLRRWVGALSVLGAWSLNGFAGAQQHAVASPSEAGEPSVADWLETYHVDASCPSRVRFRNAVQARLGRRAEEAFGALLMRVEIRRLGSSGMWRGRLEVEGDGEPRTSREVEDASCLAVVHALSLVAALAERDPLPAGAQSASTGASAELLEAVKPEATARASASSAPDTSDTGSDEASHAHLAAPRLGASAGYMLDGALTPRLATGGRLGFSVALPEIHGWAPWLELSGAALRSDDLLLSDGEVRARFDALLLGVTACPLRWTVLGRGWLQPCVEIDAGRLTGAGSGRGLARRSERHAPWASTGLSLRAGAALWGPLHVSTWFGATAPLVRHEFYFVPDTIAFRVPALGLRAGAAGGLSF